ncbi:MAG: hypothetical protein ACUVTL_06205 [Thermoproteota archaeon]
MYEYAQNDRLLFKLVKNSTLTEKQLAAYLAYQTRQHKTSGSYYSRLGERVSKGVFHRTLQQARRNVKRSILTIILLGYLDVTDVTDVTKDITELLEVGRKIKELKSLNFASEMDSSASKVASELLSEILKKLDQVIK